MIKKYNILVLFLAVTLIVTSCKTNYSYVAQTNNSSISLDSTNLGNSDYTAVIAPYKEKLDAKMDVVIGHIEEDMIPYGSRIELPLGNLCADVQHKQAEKYLKKKVDFSLINFGGLRSALNKGPFTIRTAFELMPFDNDLLVMELDGATTKKLFEHIGKGKRMAISNSVITYKDDKLVSAVIGGKDFDINGTYNVALSDYLANGGGGMNFLRPITKRYPTGKKLRDVIIDYVKDLNANGKKVSAKIEGRMVFQ